MSPAIATDLRVNPFLHIDGDRIYNPLTDRALLAGEREYQALRRVIDGGEIDEQLEKDGWLVRGDVSRLHRLKIVSLETMTACNQKCYFCPVSIAPREDYDMPVALFERIVNQLTAYRDTLESVFLQSYNEPTLDRRFVDFCKTLFAAKLPVAVLSNGSGLTPAKVDALIEAGPLHYICINLSTLDRERYTRDRGEDHLAAVLRNLDYVKSRPLANVMKIVVLGTGDAVHDADFEAITKRFQETRFTVERHVVMDRAGWLDVGLKPETPKKRLAGCDNLGSRPLQHLHITPRGQCVLCCEDYDERYLVGDLTSNTVAEVLEGPELATMRKWVYGIEEAPDDFMCRDCIFARTGECSSERLRSPAVIEAVSAAALVCLNVLLYRKVFGLWWTYDDANILRSMFEHPFLAPFIDSHVWPQQLFTPMLLMAFDAQWKLFAFDARHWYAMQMAIACLTTLSVYAAVRQFLDTKRAFVAAAIFAAGPPLCSVVTQISTVHYYLAISFCALAVVAWVVALRRPSGLALGLSIGCYLLAMLSKEVAIPLPLLLVALPLRDLRTRIRFVIGHGVATIVYFAWRYSVIGTVLGAYGWKIDAAEWPKLLALLPWRIVQGAAGAGAVIGLILVALMTLTIVAGVRNRRMAALLIAAILLVGVPMLPLAKEVNRRYVVVPWLAWSVAFAAATTRRSNRVAAALLVVAPLLAVAANRQEWRHEFPLRRRMSDEARFFFFDLPPNALLRRPLTPPAAMGEVKWLKTVHFVRPAGDWFYDDIFLCGGGGAGGKRVFEYERTGIVEITPRVAGIAAQFCGSLRSAPLSAAFHYRNPALYWDLGPYTEGRYTAVLGNGLQAFEIPRRDALNLERGIPGLALRVRYDSPAGWTTYSPELALDFVHHPDFAWHR